MTNSLNFITVYAFCLVNKHIYVVTGYDSTAIECRFPNYLKICKKYKITAFNFIVANTKKRVLTANDTDYSKDYIRRLSTVKETLNVHNYIPIISIGEFKIIRNAFSRFNGLMITKEAEKIIGVEIRTNFKILRKVLRKHARCTITRSKE